MKKKINLKMKNKKLLVALAIGGAILFICLISAIFTSNKERFLSYLLGMESKYKTEKIEKSLLEYLTKKDTTVYKNQGNAKVSLSGLDKEELKLSNLNKSNITFEGITDLRDEVSQQRVTVNYNNGRIAPVEFRRSRDLYAIQANSTENPYVGVRNNNLRALAHLLGVDDSGNIPDQIMTDRIEFTEKELKKLSKKYYKILKKNLENREFSKEKNGNQTILKYSSKQKNATSALLKVVEELSKDEMVLEKIQLELRSQYDSLIEDIKRTLEQQRDTYGENKVEMKMYIVEGEVTKCEVYIFEGEDVSNKAVVELKQDNISMKIYDREEMRMSLSLKMEKTENDIAMKASLRYMEEYGENIEFDISMSYKNVSELDNVEENITLKLITSNNEYEAEGEKKEINLETNNKITFTPDVIVERFEEYDTTVINELREEEFQTVVQTLYRNLGLI